MKMLVGCQKLCNVRNNLPSPPRPKKLSHLAILTLPIYMHLQMVKSPDLRNGLKIQCCVSIAENIGRNRKG